MPVKPSKATPAQCKAITSSGARCKAKPHERGLCFFHSDPALAAELGRKGGRRNRKVYESAGADVVPPKSASEVKDLLAEAMASVRSGKMDPKLGSTLGYLGTSLLRAIETSDVEERLRKLEETERWLGNAQENGK